MEYYCTICEKKYKSYKSLWKHNYIYHKKDVVINTTENIENRENVVVKNLEIEKNNETNNIIEKVEDNRICKYCNKKLCDRKYRWKHEQKCKSNNEMNKIELVLKENSEIKNTNSKIEKENMEIKKEMENLKNMLQKALKIHPKTLQKINNQLNNTNNGTINNNTVIIQLGKEDLTKMLTMDEKISILNRQAMGINDLVKLVHTSGKYQKCMNVYITNLQNTIGYMYDEKQNNFIAVNKNELLNDLVDSRMYDIEKFYDKLQTKFEPEKAKRIKKFIDRMKNGEDCLKDLKKEEIKLILYNNREAISTILPKISSNEIENKTDKKNINL